MPASPLSFLPYKRRLRSSLQTARGKIRLREGVILRWEDDSFGPFFSEIAVLEHFGTESLTETVSTLRKLVSAPSFQLTESRVEEQRNSTPALAFGLECLLLQLSPQNILLNDPPESRHLSVSKLIPSWETEEDIIGYWVTEGFETFKLKIGLQDLKTEVANVSRLASILGGKARLRLDANEGLSSADAAKWLEWTAQHNSSSPGAKIEYIEQPLKRDCLKDLIKLSRDYETPIALDESVATTADILKCSDAGWNGIYAIKPLRLQNLGDFLEWRASHSARIVYNSVLETSFGMQLILRLAASDPEHCFATGTGVGHLFEEDGFVLRQTGSTVSPDWFSPARLDDLWQSLSEPGL